MSDESNLKELFDEVFGADGRLLPRKPGTDLDSEKRGIPVSFSASEANTIHNYLSRAYLLANEANDAAGRAYARANTALAYLKDAITEIEFKISDQEKESGIGGTDFLFMGDNHE